MQKTILTDEQAVVSTFFLGAPQHLHPVVQTR
jgi:hypothetical protein